MSYKPGDIVVPVSNYRPLGWPDIQNAGSISFSDEAVGMVITNQPGPSDNDGMTLVLCEGTICWIMSNLWRRVR